MARGFSLKQPSFAGGVISPQALGRTDQNKYATGLRTCLNAQVTRFGTVENRSGTAYCGAVKDQTTTQRLVPFISFLGTSYVLEFQYTTIGGTGFWMRPWKNGALIPWGTLPAWSSATAYTQGSVVTYSGNTWYCVTPNTNTAPIGGSFSFWIQVSSSNVEVPLFISYWVSTTTYQIGQWVSYQGANYLATAATTGSFPSSLTGWSVINVQGLMGQPGAVAAFQYVQQNDILTIAAQGMTPIQVSHYSDTHWTVAQVAITSASAPTGVGAVAGTPTTPPTSPVGSATGGLSNGTGFNPDQYKMVAFTASGTSVSTSSIISVNGTDYTATLANPITISWSAIGGVVGYAIYKAPSGSGTFGLLAIVEGATSYNDNGSITPAGAISIPPTGAAGTTQFTYVVTALVNGVESVASAPATCYGSTPSVGAPNTISWNSVSGATTYNVYRIVNGVAGFIGQQPQSPFKDTNILPGAQQPPVNTQSLFTSLNDTPAVVAYYQQRLCFANTLNAPSTVWMSNVGAYTTFSIGIPAADSQYVQFTLAGAQVQPITALVDLGKLIVHTTNGEYVVTGNAFGTITPSAISVVNTGSAGSALIQPTVIGNTDLFVQYGATRLCDLRYEVQRFTFAGKDTTKFATDLFKGRTIVCTAYQKLPHSIVWCVLDNGTMVGLTYVSEDELYAWHLHATTNGAFEQVACVIEGSQWALYAVVRRTINGSMVRYLERFSSRDCIDTVLLSDSVFLDASLTFDGRNTGSTTMTVTTGAGWTPSDTLTITASAGYFVSGDVGNRIVLQQKDATTGLVTAQAVFDIRGYTSATVVTAVAEQNVPTWAQNVATTRWGKAVKSFSGIGHLQGQSIGVLADGNVAADPLGPIGGVTVQPGGTFTLTTPAMVVTAGLPIQTDVQTLPLENAQGESIQNKRIAVREATPVLYNSRGGSYGQDSSHLNPWKQPNPATGFPIAPYTGPVRIPVQGTFQTTGSVWMRHTEPTPWAMSGVIVTVEVGD